MTDDILPQRLLILTGDLEAERLGAAIRTKAPANIEIIAITTADELEQLHAKGIGQTRLVSFCTNVIVPGTVLRDLSLEPYNIHPGSPEYPGIYPEAFAIYEGAKRFSATAHVMADRVDTGDIVRTAWFDVPGGWDRERLAARAYEAALGLFFEVIVLCMAADTPLTRTGENWSAPRRTRAQYDALCEPAADPREAERRLRAFKPHYPS